MNLVSEIPGPPSHPLPSPNFGGGSDGTVMLGVLAAVERQPQMTQRRLSSELGIALGLANSILKRCVRHGLIKISQAPLNRYSYYLTPTGFAEKSRLTLQHLSYSFHLFRDARTQYAALFGGAAAQGLRRVALLGASELAEAAQLSARETGIAIVAVHDRDYLGPTHVGIPVVRVFAALVGQADALALTDMKAPQATLDEALALGPSLGFEPARILVPALLGVRASAPEAAS